MKSSQRLIDYLKKAEGYSGVAYRCPAGVLTIGYGHTAGVKEGDKIYSGRGVSVDIIEASVKAYVSAVNRAIYYTEERGKE